MRSGASVWALCGSLLALHCGGESTVEQKRAPGRGGDHGGAGRAGAPGGGTGGLCSPCAAGNAGNGAARGGDGGVGGAQAGRGQAGAPASGGPGEAGTGQAGTPTSGAGGLAGASAAGGQAGRAVGGTAGDATVAGAAGASEPGDDVAITKVAMYQAVEIPLLTNGVDVVPNGNAPVIDGREALLRVWLTPSSGWAARQVAGDLTITSDSGTRVARTSLTLQGTSTDGDLTSTLNFTVRANEVGQATTFVLDVHEAVGSGSLARWPSTGERLLNAESSHGPFLVTLVPLTVNGHTPDTGETNRARFERYLSRLYPATAVDVTVRAAVKVDDTVYPDGTGWDAALDDLLATRDADQVPANVYYYGVVTPASTFDGYCQNDCVVGLSNVAGRTQEQYRGAIGTGYFESAKDTFSQETMAHELGHALGRDHSPCGTDDPDRAFPYASGYIGVHGWDGTRLLDPAEYTDVMGYCLPVWISDYTYDHLFDRIFYVNGLAARELPAPAARTIGVPHQTLRVSADGRLHWGRTSSAGVPVDGPTTPVDLLDANGRLITTLTVPFAPFDHLPGGFLTLPSDALTDPTVARVRVGDRTLDVR